MPPPEQHDASIRDDHSSGSDMSIDPMGSDMSIDDQEADVGSPVKPAGGGGPQRNDSTRCQLRQPVLRRAMSSLGAAPAKLPNVLDRIKVSDAKQQELQSTNTLNASTTSSIPDKPRKAELRRLNSDISVDKSNALRRWAGGVSTTSLGHASSSSDVKDIAVTAASQNFAADSLKRPASKIDESKPGGAKLPAVTEQLGQKDRPQRIRSHRRSYSTGGAGISSVKDQLSLVSQFRSSLSKTEGFSSSPKATDAQIERKGLQRIPEVESPKRSMRAQWKTSPAKLEGTSKELASSALRATSRDYTVDAAKGPQETKFHGHASGSTTQIRQFSLSGPSDETPQSVQEPTSYGEYTEVFDVASFSLVEPAHTLRPSKGNQQLNDELRMKADELERLFAAHKQRAYGEEMASSQRTQTSQEPKTVETISEEVSGEDLPGQNMMRESSSSSSSDDAESDGDMPLQMMDDQAYDCDAAEEHDNLSWADYSRGALYNAYMQKREAKQREEWESKKVEKEANMMAMKNRIEEIANATKVLFAGSVQTRDASPRRRAERMRSFSVHSAIESKEKTVEHLHNYEEGSLQEVAKHHRYGYHKDKLFGDECSTIMNSNEILSNRSLSSSTARTSVAPIPKPSVISLQTVESPRCEKESLQESSDGFQLCRNRSYNGTTYDESSSRSIGSRNLLSSRSVSSSSTRASVAAIPSPTAQTSCSRLFGTLSNDTLSQLIWSPPYFRKENTKPPNELSKMNSHTEPRSHAHSKSITTEVSIGKEEKLRRSGSLRKSSAGPGELKDLSTLNPSSANLRSESKSFLRKGNGIGPGAGVGVAKLKPPLVQDTAKDGNEPKALMARLKDSPETVSGTSSEGPPSSVGSRNFGDHLYEERYIQDIPRESPASWNSSINSSLTYVYGAFFDASVNSPAASSKSRSPLNQMHQADAGRSRKRWGSTHNPFSVSSSSRQPPKDATKGFKRLLTFGKKTRDKKSAVNDRISASKALEYDFETSSAHHLRSPSLANSRMTRSGYYSPVYGGTNSGNVFHEKATRSLLSLPSLRSRGIESKHR